MTVVWFLMMLSLWIDAPPGDDGFDLWRVDTTVQVEDAYKWIHQSTQGGEHGVPSRQAAARWLQNEWAGLTAPTPDEVLVEPLGTSGIVRLHLRPFKARGGTQEAVLDAFLASAAEVVPGRAAFEHQWQAFGVALARGDIGSMTRRAWDALDARTRPQGYPAIHHSDTYNRERRPAYRVLTATRATALVRTLAPSASTR